MSNTKDYHWDATPTWNGFGYQAKVSIYAFLAPPKSSDKHALVKELEIEGIEDFAIIWDGKYKSIHQVKAYNKTTLSEYTDAVYDLILKLMGLIPDAVFVRFFEQTSLDTITKTKLVKDVKKQLSSTGITSIIHGKHKIITPDSSKVYLLKFPTTINHDVQEAIKKTIAFYIELSNQLDSVDAWLHTLRIIKFDKKALLTHKIIKDLKNQKIVPFDKFDEILTRINLYNYDGLTFDCLTEKLHSLNIRLINQWQKKDNKELAEKIYSEIRMFLDDYVSDRHEKSNRAYDEEYQAMKKINWKDIYEIIKTADVELDESTNKRKISVLKGKFNTQLRRQIEITLKDKSLNNEELNSKIERIQLRINALFKKYKNENFFELCRNISPRRNGEKMRLKELTEILDPTDGIKNPYFKFFADVNRDLGEGDNHKFKHKDEFYLPTIIRYDEEYEVSKDIINYAPETVFETDYIISLYLDGKTIGDCVKNISDIREEDINDERNDDQWHNRITNAKDVKLVNLKTAVQNFNND